ncbi:hypothetical protein [Acaryochloris marina]|uniref:hypothetical protein n=1 Tax=Acaryochloris marina TaxID=155978 RepID=UPI0021C2CB84|nr:hypothetical protein [Acaryochloris marina]BDM78772.1 hypothetical protein AM10699_16410 [Acaryochloris marina MBIC10699]
MALPKKKSRSITVDDTRYRWMVSIHQHVLYLTIEAEDDPGQTFQALFEPHDQFKREADENWSFHRQGRSLTPRDVTKIIRYGLANNWKPQSKGQKPILLYAWDAERVAPGAQNPDTNEVPLRDIAIEQVSDLRFDLSLDPYWRKTLFAAELFKRFTLPEDYFGISNRARDCGLHFAVFNDGYTECGFVVFGIESVDFPDVAMYTTNNPSII